MDNSKTTMEKNEILVDRGMGQVRNYGIAVLLALLALNGVALGALHLIESNDTRNELIKYAETIPAPDVTKAEQTIHLPEDIIALRSENIDRAGFYETSIGEQDYLVYGDVNKHYMLMKSEETIQKEIFSFGMALSALYVGEVIILLGWWLFVRTKVREVFEMI